MVVDVQDDVEVVIGYGVLVHTLDSCSLIPIVDAHIAHRYHQVGLFALHKKQYGYATKHQPHTFIRYFSEFGHYLCVTYLHLLLCTSIAAIVASVVVATIVAVVVTVAEVAAIMALAFVLLLGRVVVCALWSRITLLGTIVVILGTVVVAVVTAVAVVTTLTMFVIVALFLAFILTSLCRSVVV